MMIHETDIKHEAGDFWVLKDRQHRMYVVYRNGITHSTGDSCYRMTDEGLSIAIARCDYLAKRDRAANPGIRGFGA